MPKALKRTLAVIGAIIAIATVAIGGYVIYLQATYYRIPDNAALEVQRNSTATLETNVQYKVATYNIGFGAYTPDYTFFLDEGIAKDGTKTVGSRGTANSRESVEACTAGAIAVLENTDADFMLLQEVDTDSTRSHHVNQRATLEEAFATYSAVFAENFHSGFLALPITDMHGIANAGLLVLGDTYIDAAVRRSFPVSDAFPAKFFDLDRCFVVERLPVSNGKELVLVNSHMSAYDEGGTVRAQQLDLLCSVLEQEAAKGNYVIAGGDWNHALGGSEALYESDFQVPAWVSTFDDGLLPDGFSVVIADNIADVPTCRNNDVPYEKGHTYTVTVDGFIVSDNVRATAQNVDTGFQYSDHNPVLLIFKLEG